MECKKSLQNLYSPNLTSLEVSDDVQCSLRHERALDFIADVHV